MPTTPAEPARLARLLVAVRVVTAVRDLLCASALSVFAYHTPTARRMLLPTTGLPIARRVGRVA